MIHFRLPRFMRAGVATAYAGEPGELWMDVISNTLILQDGSRGGVAIASAALATQLSNGLLSAADKITLDTISNQVEYDATDGLLISYYGDNNDGTLELNFEGERIDIGDGESKTLSSNDSIQTGYVTINSKGRITSGDYSFIIFPDIDYASSSTITVSSSKEVSRNVYRKATASETFYAGSYGPPNDASLNFGDSFYVPFVNVDDYANVACANRYITLPSLSGSNGLTGTGSISRATSGVSAGGYGPSVDTSLAANETFLVPYLTVDTYGRITAIKNTTITVPSDPNTDTHYTGYLRAGASTGTDNAAVTSNPYLKYVENSTVRSYVRLVAGTGTTIASDSSGNVTIGLTTSGVSSGSYGPSANASPGSGGTFSVPYVTVDTYGRVTAASSKTITMPSVPTNTDTHYTGYLRAGSSSGTANAAVTSNPYIFYVENGSRRSAVRLVAGTGTTIVSDSSGNVTITITPQTYSLPTASSSTLGGVKIGSNISISSGTISVATATTSVLGVAKFSSSYFTVTDGKVDIRTDRIMTLNTQQAISGAGYFPSPLQIYNNAEAQKSGVLHLTVDGITKTASVRLGATRGIMFNYSKDYGGNINTNGSISNHSSKASVAGISMAGYANTSSNWNMGPSGGINIFTCALTADSTACGVLSMLYHKDSIYALIGYVQNSSMSLGASGGLWKQVYASTTTISTSDERVKSEIQDFGDVLLSEWDSVKFKTFKFNDAIEEKGFDAARIHTGVVAQQIMSVVQNVDRYAFFCHDVWTAEEVAYDDVPERNAPAGDLYMVRYSELLCIEAAYWRRKADTLEQRLHVLEQLCGFEI